MIAGIIHEKPTLRGGLFCVCAILLVIVVAGGPGWMIGYTPRGVWLGVQWAPPLNLEVFEVRVGILFVGRAFAP